MAAFFAVFLYGAHGPQDSASLALFEFIPEGLIHWTGVAVMAVMTLSGIVGIATMARRVARHEGVSLTTIFGGRAALARSASALWSALGVESLGQRRYREDDKPAEPLYRRRWLIHGLTIWVSSVCSLRP